MHRSFKSALRDGQNAERQWVDEMRAFGLSVAHGKKIVVANHCTKTGHVETPDALALFSVEIKERSISFTGPEDYPYDTVFVDDVRGLGMEPYRNLIYIYRSKPTGRWVWLTMLDRDADWKEQVTHDRGRGHNLPILVAPRRCLRPSEQLIHFVYPHLYLELVDGDTGAFVTGGGETEERDRYVAQTHPDAGGRGRKTTPKTRKHMG